MGKKSEFQQRVSEIVDYINHHKVADENNQIKLASLADFCDMIEATVTLIDELECDEQEKFDNMPEGFQQGPNGQRIEERIEQLQSWASSIESMEVDWDSLQETLESNLDMTVREALTTFFKIKLEEMLEEVPQ